MPSFDFGAYLTDNGMELVGMDPTGLPRVRDPDGKEGTFDYRTFLSDQGVKPGSIDVQFNTQETALQTSPLEASDRAKLSLGNDSGRLRYLKSRFEDARVTEDGLVVKKAGAWHAVDPSTVFSGDAWETAKEIGRDLADWAGDVPVIAGAIAGATAGGGAASIAGAGAGGSAGEAIRTSLGRVYGTYDASAEEQLRDIGLEALLNAGGQRLAIGVRPSLSKLASAAKTIGSKASSITKDLLAQSLGATTGAKTGATHVLFDNADDVVSRIGKYGSTIDDQVTMANKGLSEEFLDHSSKQLSKRFGELLDSSVALADKNKTVNFTTIADDMTKAVQDSGLASFDKATNKWRPLSPKEIGKRLSQGEAAETLDKDTAKKVASFTSDVVNSIKGIEQLKGGPAVKALAGLNSAINRASQNYYQDPVMSRLISGVKNTYSKALDNSMESLGVLKQWQVGKALYAQYDDAVDFARKAIQSDAQLGLFSDRLLNDTQVGRRTVGIAKQLIELGGPKSRGLYDEIVKNETARRFSSIFPRQGLAPQLGGAGAIAGLASGIAPATILAGTTVLSPRIVASEVKYGMRGLRWMQSNLTGAKNVAKNAAFLQDPRAVATLLRTIASGPAKESQDTQSLLQEADSYVQERTR